MFSTRAVGIARPETPPMLVLTEASLMLAPSWKPIWNLLEGRFELLLVNEHLGDPVELRRPLPDDACAIAHRWPKRATRSPSVRATFAGGISSVG